ncbi:MAG: hypothetical protein AAFR47_13115 [Pseudomonadota bacterium]
MNGLAILGLIGVSLAGLGYMAVTDAKRRRVFDLPAFTGRRWLWPARAAVFGPGLVLAAAGHWSGATIWAGAVTVLGWAMAALPPATYARLWAEIAAGLGTGKGLLKATRSGAAPLFASACARAAHLTARAPPLASPRVRV